MKFKTNIQIKKIKVKPKLAVLSALLVVIVIQIFFILNKKSNTLLSNTNDLQLLANSIVTKCADASYKPTCYDEQIPKVMTDLGLSMEKAFDVTRLVQTQDPSYFYCHVLGHKLAAEETKKDPDNWQEVVARCPSGICSNGCIHGAFQEKFRTEALPDAKITELKPIFSNICEARSNWSPTGMEQGSCYHALGHLTMYVTGGDIDKSITLCQEVALKSDSRDFRQLCYDGAFMQIFQPLEAEDFALIEGKAPTKEGLQAFCSNYSEPMRGSCWSEGWPLYNEEISTPQGLEQHCKFLTDPTQRQRCYTAMFYVLTPKFNFDEVQISNFCSQLNNPLKGTCFANAASRMIETDWKNISKSIHLCDEADKHSAGSACFEELLLYSTYNFHPSSQEFYDLCNSLPEEWKNKCLLKSAT